MSVQILLKNCLTISVVISLTASAKQASSLEINTQVKDTQVKEAKEIVSTETEKNDRLSLVGSDNMFSEVNARTLLLSAKQSMRHHNYKKAIRLLKEAVKLDPDDTDARCLYAEALQEKLSHQVNKDPEVFNTCVRNWLMVARNETGDEKGLTYKGIGIGVSLFQDPDRAIKAKANLKKLTGYLPKPWETNERYLRRVLKPATTSVTATIKVPDENTHK